jgi:alkyldihydroxyacetonephosphate synthase
MLRLSDPQETQTSLALAGRAGLMSWTNRGLRLLGYGPERCLLVFGVTGEKRRTRTARRWIAAIVRAHGGLLLGTRVGKMWSLSRFRAPYLRNTLWEQGYALDTVETAVPWSAVLPTARAVKAAIQDGLAEDGERVLAFAHLSHVYLDGASIYVTLLYRRGTTPEETLSRWATLKGAASRAIVAHGGTISHQHGVGADHISYLPAEKGKIGMSLLGCVQRALDPEGLLNPGKLLLDS